MIAWYDCKPDFDKVKQPYKNPTDKRIKKLIDDPESSYSQFVKNGTMEDPVEYWITSAQNFEYETIPYSQENLDMMKAKFSE